jgi:hypothetical protein
MTRSTARRLPTDWEFLTWPLLFVLLVVTILSVAGVHSEIMNPLVLVLLWANLLFKYRKTVRAKFSSR